MERRRRKKKKKKKEKENTSRMGGDDDRKRKSERVVLAPRVCIYTHNVCVYLLLPETAGSIGFGSPRVLSFSFSSSPSPKQKKGNSPPYTRHTQVGAAV